MGMHILFSLCYGSTRDSNNRPFKIISVCGVNLWVIFVCSAWFGNFKLICSFSHTDIRVMEPTLESLCRSVSEVVVCTVFCYVQFNCYAMLWLIIFPGFPSNIFRGRKQYEPPRYMTINTAIEQLLEVEQKQGESGEFQQLLLSWSFQIFLCCVYFFHLLSLQGCWS